jgi:hypothetical protein
MAFDLSAVVPTDAAISIPAEKVQFGTGHVFRLLMARILLFET